MAKTKHNLANLDAGQLDVMWQFLRLKNKNTCIKEDVQSLKADLDIIRQALIQKDGGMRKNFDSDYVDLTDLGTYINLAILDALQLYIYGGLDVLEEILPEGDYENE